MAVPKYDDFYNVILKFLADGEFHAVDACKNFVREEMKLTDADITELKSDGQPKWLARVDWCLITLEKSGMIRFQDAQIQITDAGQKISGEKVTIKLLMERGSPELVEYVKNRRAKNFRRTGCGKKRRRNARRNFGTRSLRNQRRIVRRTVELALGKLSAVL